jgi:hypothetical protein
VKQALICVDNLRIGGYQRLALDEAYALSDRGFKVIFIVLEEIGILSGRSSTFLEVEKDLIRSKDIKFKYVSFQRIKLFMNLWQEKGIFLHETLVISHSLRCTLVLRLLKIFTGNNKIVVNTKIHQLPCLTHTKQRFSRFIYAQFTDRLFVFSKAVMLSWSLQFGFSFAHLLRSSKKVNLLRNGVYLSRLPFRSPGTSNSIARPRIIFLGRVTFWKGLEIFEKLSVLLSLKDFDFLFIVPSYSTQNFSKLHNVLGGRLKIVEGKSINHLEFFNGDVHIYPTQYGEKAKFIESISLNCLEMAGIGIPSLITEGGQLTWTEPVFKEIFHEVDWQDIDQVAKQIIAVSKLRVSRAHLEAIRNQIDINSELDALICRV